MPTKQVSGWNGHTTSMLFLSNALPHYKHPSNLEELNKINHLPYSQGRPIQLEELSKSRNSCYPIKTMTWNVANIRNGVSPEGAQYWGDFSKAGIPAIQAKLRTYYGTLDSANLAELNKINCLAPKELAQELIDTGIPVAACRIPEDSIAALSLTMAKHSATPTTPTP